MFGNPRWKWSTWWIQYYTWGYVCFMRIYKPMSYYCLICRVRSKNTVQYGNNYLQNVITVSMIKYFIFMTNNIYNILNEFKWFSFAWYWMIVKTVLFIMYQTVLQLPISFNRVKRIPVCCFLLLFMNKCWYAQRLLLIFLMSIYVFPSADVSLRGQLIVYDNVNHLIGWMPSDCVKPQSLDLPPSLWGM